MEKINLDKINQDSSTKAWNGLKENEWITLAQNGESRIHFIMPYTLEKLGDVEGKKILDLGCGEGGYARALTKKGAQVVCVDCSEPVLCYALGQAEKENLKIEHYLRNSNNLFGLENNSFDIVLCSMMLMDCEDFDGTLKEAARVLKPGGKLFASVLHPCFDGNHDIGIGRQGNGIDRQVVVMNYFEPETWEAPLFGGETPVVWRHRTLQDYVKAFVKSGFAIVDLDEPRATNEQAKISVSIAWLQKIPLFLFWELKKS